MVDNKPCGGYHTGGVVYLPEITVYNDPDIRRAKIWLTGRGLYQNDLLITKELTSGEDHRALLELAGENEVEGVYDIYLRGAQRAGGGAMYLHFDLPESRAGESFILARRKAGGGIEYFYSTADAKGDLHFGAIYELSVFMLFKGKNSRLSTIGVAEAPATGDGAITAMCFLLSAAGLAAGAFCLRKKRRA